MLMGFVRPSKLPPLVNHFFNRSEICRMWDKLGSSRGWMKVQWQVRAKASWLRYPHCSNHFPLSVSDSNTNIMLAGRARDEGPSARHTSKGMRYESI